MLYIITCNNVSHLRHAYTRKCPKDQSCRLWRPPVEEAEEQPLKLLQNLILRILDIIMLKAQNTEI